MTSTTNKTTPADHQEVLGAFAARKAEFDALIERLRGLSDDHFGLAPDEVTWGQVSTLDYETSILRHLSDMTFREGQYAPRKTA